MEVEKAVGWDSEESGRTEPKTAQFSASADAKGNQAGAADAEEVRGRPLTCSCVRISIILLQGGSRGIDAGEKKTCSVSIR